MVQFDPFPRLTDEQLENILDEAIAHDESRLIWQVVSEIERRGQVLEV